MQDKNSSIRKNRIFKELESDWVQLKVLGFDYPIVLITPIEKIRVESIL